MAHVSRRRVRLITRSGLDWTRRYGDLPAAFKVLPCREAIIDGEIVVLDERASAVSRCCRTRCPSAPATGWSSTPSTCSISTAGISPKLRSTAARRCSRSSSPVSQQPLGDPAQRPCHGDGQRALRTGVRDGARRGRLQARLGALPERPLKTWIKTKALNAAISSSPAIPPRRPPRGSPRWRWANGSAASWNIAARSAPASMPRCCMAASGASSRCARAPSRSKSAGTARDMIWVRPLLSAHIHYSNRTTDNALRHPVFKGLRDVELSAPVTQTRKRLISEADSRPSGSPTRRGGCSVNPVPPSSTSRSTMRRSAISCCRTFSAGRCRWCAARPASRRTASSSAMPSRACRLRSPPSKPAIRRARPDLPRGRGCQGISGAGAVRRGRVPHLGRLRSRPDRARPRRLRSRSGRGDRVARDRRGGRAVRAELPGVGLVPFVKTSGGKGIHVVVPVTPKLGSKQSTRRRDIAAQIAAREPKPSPRPWARTTASGGSSSISTEMPAALPLPRPIVARPRHLPASTPLGWRDLESIDAPEDLNYSSLPGLFTTSGDPWADSFRRISP